MSDKPETTNPEDMNLPIQVLAQYVKDLSFENPNAPDSLRPSENAPPMDVNVGMDARKIEDGNVPNMYEVVLNVQATAGKGQDTLFIIEVQYAALVSIGESVPQGGHHPILLIEVPRMIFPYARQFISNLTIHGGYPPLLLNPVDFQALYMQRFGDEIAKAESGAGEEADEKKPDTSEATA